MGIPVTKEWFETQIERIPWSGCWVWVGTALQENGYSHIKRDGKHFSVHRISYKLYKGEIDFPELRHTCDIRCCVNPYHLIGGTFYDNMNDRDIRNRTAKHERHGMAKLTVEQVEEIRGLYIRYDREFGGKALGRRYGVSGVIINLIGRNKLWKF